MHIHAQLQFNFSDQLQDIPVAPNIGCVETDRERSTEEIVRTQEFCCFKNVQLIMTMAMQLLFRKIEELQRKVLTEIQKWKDESGKDMENLKKNQACLQSSIAKIQKTNPEENLDMKRAKQCTQLKEIWKQGESEARALKATRRKSQKHQSTLLLAWIFGIAPADFQSGDIGSKAIRPSSRFHTSDYKIRSDKRHMHRRLL